ncbi:MAG: hypothetical protein GC162_16030 [Planctomycetes bacterium]|nr:hypothetical protein [Planctomycetota bacterium]
MQLIRRMTFGFAATILLAASQCFAQIPPKPGPPPNASAGEVYIPWGIVVGLMIIVCFGAWKSSGRTHQD